MLNRLWLSAKAVDRQLPRGLETCPRYYLLGITASTEITYRRPRASLQGFPMDVTVLGE